MNKRWIALALAMTFGLALGANIASAEDALPAAVFAAAQTAEKSEAAGTTETEAPEPDAEGTLSFDNLRSRMLEHYYPLLALEENIRTLEEWDYKRTEDELRDQLNETANRQWAAMSAGSSAELNDLNAAISAALGSNPELNPTNLSLQASQAALAASTAAGAAVSSLGAQQLQMQYDALRDAFDDVRDGKLQKDNEGVKRQLRNLQNQTVIVAESLYITRKGLEAQDASLARTIASLGRTEQEMALREKLGQISALQLQQVQLGAVQAESGRKTLEMNMDNILMQLKAMSGVELDQSLSLAALPTVTAEQLAAMSPEQDLAAAQEASYELYDAKKTYDDAKTAYEDARKEYGEYSKKNEWMQAKHTWQAAQYTYENAKQSYELKFRTLYAQVKDAAQIIESKRAALAAQEKSYQVSALKYQQGTISANELANAGDELAKVKDELASAERDLFTQYRSYQWAVEYGILNS